MATDRIPTLRENRDRGAEVQGSEGAREQERRGDCGMRNGKLVTSEPACPVESYSTGVSVIPANPGSGSGAGPGEVENQGHFTGQAPESSHSQIMVVCKSCQSSGCPRIKYGAGLSSPA